jgi:hypothetical protein
MSHTNDAEAPARKDPEREHPVATAWRPVFREVVRAFVAGDFRLGAALARGAEIDDKTAEQVARYVAQYGETLVDLPDETWKSSVAQWTEGYWDVLVDLWTVESGRSDLVLAVRVFEAGEGFRFRIDGVWVP